MAKCSKCGVLKILRAKILDITPQVYAALALALHREYGFGLVRITRVFDQSGEIWQECIDTGVNII